MVTKLGSFLMTLLTACSVPDASGSALDETVGATRQPLCAGPYVIRAAAVTTTACYIWPDALAAATDGWGPQALSLSVDRGFAPQITYERGPSLSLQTDDVTRSIQAAMGFSVTESVNLVATTTVLVPTEAYCRIEAYPEYQVTGWELRVDACSQTPDTLIAKGYVYRPTGVHFRVLVLVGGEWNALRPPTPMELALAPPWSGAESHAQPGDAGDAAQGGSEAQPDAGTRIDGGLQGG
jgi:hypothetical protein